MMKKIFAFITIASMFMFSSCNSDDAGNGSSGDNSASLLRVKITEEKLSTETATRATIDASSEEQTINSLYLFFFESSSNMSGQFVDYLEINSSLDMNTQISLSIPATSAINGLTAYNILAVANIHDNQYIGTDVDTWVNENMSGRIESYVRQNLQAQTGGSQTNNNNIIYPDQILMNGTATKAAGSSDVAITLTRNVARFDVKNSVYTDYDLVSVSIWNGYPYSSVFGEGVLDYSSSTARNTRFYGITNTTLDNDGYYANITGGLYAFENQVVRPGSTDVLTTCLIVGINNRSTSTVSYYRVNVHPNESAQNLKRNNAYQVTITGVNGSGANSEAEAYSGGNSNLSYTINTWDLDDNGLIVTDAYSVLAVPVKTAKIGASGGDFEYTITAYSTLTNPEALAIKSQTYDPATGKISATLTGNVLKISAAALETGSDERAGVIIVSYAGLEASINVVQSSSVDKYLTVTLPAGGIPTFTSTAGNQSGLITVSASGNWSAKLINSNNGFSLDSSTTTAVTEMLNMTDLNYQFRVYTYTANSTQADREAFVIISLDDDPVNYASVVTVKQAAPSSLEISPSQSSVVFAGLGTILSPYNDELTVSTSNGESWDYTITQYSGSANNDSDKFTATVDSATGTITVTANGQNLSSRTYYATLRIYLTGNPTVYKEITLQQNVYSFSLSTTTVSAVAVTGGETTAISINAENYMYWKAEVVMSTTTSGKTLVNHTATIVDNSGAAITTPQLISSNNTFKVKFPKVYFPNREMAVAAKVTIKLLDASQQETGLSQTITVNQNGLYSKGVHTWSSYSSRWGAINVNSSGVSTGANYYSGFTNYFYPYMSTISPSNWSLTNGSSATDYGSGISTSKTTYVHISNNGMASGASWSYINNFESAVDGITVYMCDDYNTAPRSAINTQLSGKGYSITHNTTGTGYASLNNNMSDYRVYQFLVNHGQYDVTNTSVEFYYDGTQTEASSWPADAVPILMYSSSNACMVIDPTNAMVYHGDCTNFYASYLTGGYTRTSQYEFMYNYTDYVCYSAMYGSHFTDMLIGTDSTNTIPAPWDTAWGVNMWAY